MAGLTTIPRMWTLQREYSVQFPLKTRESSHASLFFKMSRFRKLIHKYTVMQKSTHNHTTSQLLCQISKRSLHTAQFSCLPLSRSSEFYEEGTCSNSLPPNRLERYIANAIAQCRQANKKGNIFASNAQ